MKKRSFYNFSTKEGWKYVNISNIAVIEDTNQGTLVTLNVTNSEGKHISFIADGHWGQITGEIKFLNENQEG